MHFRQITLSIGNLGGGRPQLVDRHKGERYPQNLRMDRGAGSSRDPAFKDIYRRPMSRFHTTTILLVLTALGVGLSLEGSIGYLVLGIFLTAYLFIFILGVSILKLNYGREAASLVSRAPSGTGAGQAAGDIAFHTSLLAFRQAQRGREKQGFEDHRIPPFVGATGRSPLQVSNRFQIPLTGNRLPSTLTVLKSEVRSNQRG
jgi:hypothetical protein